MLLSVTLRSGDAMFIGSDHIIKVKPDGDGSLILIDNATDARVCEPPAELAARVNARPGDLMNARAEEAFSVMLGQLRRQEATRGLEVRLRILEDIQQAMADENGELAAEFTAMLKAFDSQQVGQVPVSRVPEAAGGRACATCKHAKVDPQEMPCRACADRSHFEAEEFPVRLWRCKRCSAKMDATHEPITCPECKSSGPDLYVLVEPPAQAPVVCGPAVESVEELPKLLGDGEVLVSEPVHQTTPPWLSHPKP